MLSSRVMGRLCAVRLYAARILPPAVVTAIAGGFSFGAPFFRALYRGKAFKPTVPVFAVWREPSSSSTARAETAADGAESAEHRAPGLFGGVQA
jgi:hypothetical protein